MQMFKQKKINNIKYTPLIMKIDKMISMKLKTIITLLNKIIILIVIMFGIGQPVLLKLKNKDLLDAIGIT